MTSILKSIKSILPFLNSPQQQKKQQQLQQQQQQQQTIEHAENIKSSNNHNSENSATTENVQTNTISADITTTTITTPPQPPPIDWPSWCLEIEQRADIKPISRNGLDDTKSRVVNGFKGENFVYQNKKFTSKLYWKPVNSNSNHNSGIVGENGLSTQLYENSNNNNNNNSSSNVVLDSNGIINPLNMTIEERVIVGVISWTNKCEGPPGCVHGGALASVFDDSMACCIRYYYNNNYEEDSSMSTSRQRNYAVTANLSVNYKKFVPLESFSWIETKIQKRDGKKIYVVSKLKDHHGVLRAEATALWIVVKMDQPQVESSKVISNLNNNSSDNNSNNNNNNDDNNSISLSPYLSSIKSNTFEMGNESPVYSPLPQIQNNEHFTTNN